MASEKDIIHEYLACLKRIKESSMVCNKVMKGDSGREV